jgi:hypothetical protein
MVEAPTLMDQPVREARARVGQSVGKALGRIPLPPLLHYGPCIGSLRAGKDLRQKRRREEFKGLNALLPETKARIQPQIEAAVEQIARYEAAYTVLEQIFVVRGGLLALAAGAVIAVYAPPVPFGADAVGWQTALALVLWLVLVLPVWAIGTRRWWFAALAGLAAVYLPVVMLLTWWGAAGSPELSSKASAPGFAGAPPPCSA